MTGKVRKTVTLDPEVVAAFGEDASALSTTVNRVLLEELVRRRQRDALTALVAALDAEFGDPDSETVERFRQALA